MDTIELHHVADNNISQEGLISFINRNLNGFIVKAHYSYIGCCQSCIDVMQDHLEMAFITERLLQYSKLNSYERVYNTYPPQIFITLTPNVDDIVLLAKTLVYVSILKVEETDPPTELMEDLMIELQDFEDNIEQITFKFSDEIEDYYANYVNQGIYEIASEFTEDENEYLSSCFNKNPEWQYGFWKNHFPNIPKESVYLSSFCWIIKNDVDVSLMLSKYSKIENITFNDAALIRNLVINDFTAINFDSLANFNETISFIDKTTGVSNTDFVFQISQNIDTVKISYSGYFIIYFNFRVIREDAIRQLYNEASLLKEKFSILLGLSREVSCDWNLLTDESFEELCYDIIYNDIRFDNSTIRKMGKSKSRDGGRDMVVYTKPQPGDSAKKYIVQCKLLQKSSSLTKSIMKNVSNVIMEYEADGYMIMTNAVIDSGLYDMLDSFNRNPKMKTDTKINYSKLELERYLAGHNKIKQRYF
ncbi:MAG: hypothetical protein LBR10_14930 [Prevotellaceae bacterium]|jgi:hypothetical protein|nr:hypothetical protein [Prevotellaceae bacterium]